jgi:hypothetical protein
VNTFVAKKNYFILAIALMSSDDEASDGGFITHQRHGRVKNGGDGRNTLIILTLRTALQRARKCYTKGQLVR